MTNLMTPKMIYFDMSFLEWSKYDYYLCCESYHILPATTWGVLLSAHIPLMASIYVLKAKHHELYLKLIPNVADKGIFLWYLPQEIGD